jgi:hypothetical protein
VKARTIRRCGEEFEWRDSSATLECSGSIRAYLQAAGVIVARLEAAGIQRQVAMTSLFNRATALEYFLRKLRAPPTAD